MTGGVVLATRELPEPFDTLRADFDVRVLGYSPSEAELAAELPGVDALICLVDDSVTPAAIQAADRLKIIASYAVGVNQIDRSAAAARGIFVTHTPNVLTDATADLTLALLLALSRRIVEGDRLVRAGGFAGWAPDLLLGRDLKGKVFGIVGPGRIGKAVARRARAFGMTVIAAGRSPRDENDPDDPPRVSFDELLRRSGSGVEAVSCDLIPELTPRLLGRERRSPGAILAHRLVDLDDGENTRAHRQRTCVQAAVVSGTVEPLVMEPRDRCGCA